jgi:hypothetical protein
MSEFQALARLRTRPPPYAARRTPHLALSDYGDSQASLNMEVLVHRYGGELRRADTRRVSYGLRGHGLAFRNGVVQVFAGWRLWPGRPDEPHHLGHLLAGPLLTFRMVHGSCSSELLTGCCSASTSCG